MMVNQNLIRYITLSVYDPVISNALEIIGMKNVHLVDGVNIVENPKEEFSKLLKFLGAHDLIDFEFNKEKGMGSKNLYSDKESLINRYRRGLETCPAPSRKYPRPLLDVFACIG